MTLKFINRLRKRIRLSKYRLKTRRFQVKVSVPIFYRTLIHPQLVKGATLQKNPAILKSLGFVELIMLVLFVESVISLYSSTMKDK